MNVIVFTGERGSEAKAMQLGAVACVVKTSAAMDEFWDEVRKYAGEPDLPNQR
jgi:hypothetical protein